MMRKIKLSLVLIILFSVCLSCANPIEKDAKEAATLMKRSREAARNYDYKLSDSFFKEYKKIENRYAVSDKKEEFEQLYWAYIKDSTQNL